MSCVRSGRLPPGPLSCAAEATPAPGVVLGTTLGFGMLGIICVPGTPPRLMPIGDESGLEP